MGKAGVAAIAVRPHPLVTRRRRRQPGWRWAVENVPIIVLAAAVAGLAVAVLSGSWQVRPILSGSMQPQLPVGGVAISERMPLAALQTGDVIIFRSPADPQELVVHRVISMQPTTGGVVVKTKGDANSFVDPWSPFVLKGPYVYRVWGTVPFVGYLGVAVHSELGQRAAFGGAIVLIVIAAIYLVWPTRRPRRTRQQA